MTTDTKTYIQEKLEDLRNLKAAVKATEEEIFTHMREALLEEVEFENVKATLKEAPVWDELTLDQLREYLSPAQIAELKNKPTEPTWNKRKVAKLAGKEGGDIAKIVQQAQSTAPRFTVKVG